LTNIILLYLYSFDRRKSFLYSMPNFLQLQKAKHITIANAQKRNFDIIHIFHFIF